MLFTERALRDYYYCEALLLQGTERQQKDQEKQWFFERNGTELAKVLETGMPTRTVFGEVQGNTRTAQPYEGAIYIVHPSLDLLMGFSKVEKTGSSVTLSRNVRKPYVKSRHETTEEKIATAAMMILREYGVEAETAAVTFENRTVRFFWDEAQGLKVAEELKALAKILDGNDVSPTYRCKWCSWKECPFRGKAPEPALEETPGLDGIAGL